MMACCLALLAGVTTATSQNLILNGSFEAPVIPADTYQQATPTSWSWSSSVGSIGNGNIGPTWPLAQDQQQAIDIGNSPSFALSQSFSITGADTFVLSWYDNTGTPPSESLYSVAILDGSSQTIVSTNLDASHAGQWQARELHVGLVPGDYTLRFRAEGNGNSHDTLLDNVRLESVQLPGTVVSGTIVNQVWTSAGSPYRVVGNIQVAGLMIQPGITVLMWGNYAFEIAGTLKAVGTSAEPILFTAPNSGWQGLFFNAAQPGCELAHCIIEKSLSSGIRIVNTTPRISDSIIRSNGMAIDVWQAGNVAVELNGAGIKTDSSLVLENCTIQDNFLTVSVRANDATATARGGGIYSTAPLTLRNCKISSNALSATAYLTGSGPGSAFCEGGGVWAGTSLTMQNCLIEGNSVNADSATVGGPSVTFSLGGGIFSQGLLLQRNSIVARNTAAGDVGSGREFKLNGGGTYIEGSLSSIENCTVAYNAPNGLATGTDDTKVINSIFWGNTVAQIIGTTNVTYSDVQGGFTGQGNISGNPIFLSSSKLIIVPGSPCINAGDTNVVYQDVYFPPSLGLARNDMGAHGGPGAGARLRARFASQAEVVIMGAVPGYTYLLQGSAELSDWPTVMQFQVTDLGESRSFLEPVDNPLPYRFYRLNLAP